MKTHKIILISTLGILVVASWFAYQRYSAQQAMTEHVKECDLCSRRHAAISRTRKIIRESKLKAAENIEQ